MNYLFMSIPPYCGSTVLHNYIAKCSNVVALSEDYCGDDTVYANGGCVEGNTATKARALYGDKGFIDIRLIPGLYASTIQNPKLYDWPNIKRCLDDNWNTANPNASIRLQKTPNDTYRVKLMQENFSDAKWILMLKNPYALAQSIIHMYLRGNINPSNKAEHIANHIINTYYLQRENQLFLGNNAYTMTYEDLTNNPTEHLTNLKVWMPELHDLSFEGMCLVKDVTHNGLVNNNAERIEAFRNIPGAVDKFNSYFSKHEDILNYWNYELI